MTETGLPTPRRYWAILGISFGTALVVIDGSIATVALPTIARDLGVAPSAAVLVVTVYQLVIVMTLLSFANLGDRLGHKRLYQGGQIVFTVATALCFFAKSLPFLLVVRAVQALGAAAALSMSAAMVRAVYPASQLGRGIGVNSVVVASSVALAPTLGGLILGFAAWPWVFAAAVPFGLVSLLLGRSLPDTPPRDHVFDVLGAVLCAAFFGLLITGLESLVHGDSPVVSLAIVAVGAVVGVIFVRRELTDAHPILPVDLLANPVLALSVTGAFAAFVGSMTMMLTLPFRLSSEYGLGPEAIGLMIAPWPLATMIVAPIAGAMSDRYPVGLLGVVGMTIAVAGLTLMAWLPLDLSWFDVAWRMGIAGAGYGLFLSPNARLILSAAPAARAAAAGSLISTNRLVAQTLGATLVATLLALGLGGGSTPPLIAAGLAAIAGLCSVARLNPLVARPRAADAADL